MKKIIAVVLTVALLSLGLGASAAIASPGIWEMNPGTEVSVTDDTITLGQVRDETPDQQPIAVHGATIELPPAEQIYVEFNYDLYTWDSYNPPTVAGTGYWDLFSISVSQSQYWTLGLSDPLDGDPLDIGFSRGGILYGDGVLDSWTGSGSAMMAASTASTNYLNVVLDTATAPHHNGNYGSWGEIEITKIEILGVPDVTKVLVDAWPHSDPQLGGDDNILNLGEKWYFWLDITVTNNTFMPINNVVVKDNFGGDLELVWLDNLAAPSPTPAKKESITWGPTTPGNSGTVQYTGKTDKAHLFWTSVGTLDPGDTATLTVVVATDMNTGKNKNFPDGHQEYTSEGEHCLNSGATSQGSITLTSGAVWPVSDTTDEICVNIGDDFDFDA